MCMFYDGTADNGDMISLNHIGCGNAIAKKIPMDEQYRLPKSTI